MPATTNPVPVTLRKSRRVSVLTRISFHSISSRLVWLIFYGRVRPCLERSLANRQSRRVASLRNWPRRDGGRHPEHHLNSFGHSRGSPHGSLRFPLSAALPSSSPIA